METPDSGGGLQWSRPNKNGLRNVEAERLLIVSHIRFVREALADLLHRAALFGSISVAADIASAQESCAQQGVTLLLLDSAIPYGFAAVRRIRQKAPSVTVAILAVAETENDVVAWARAGATAYVPQEAGIKELIDFLGQIMLGEQPCTRRVAAGLLRALANGTTADPVYTTPAGSKLTGRECELAKLVQDGLSNKEIARQLRIEVSTVKSHIHNLLGKLNVNGRSEIAALLSADGRFRDSSRDGRGSPSRPQSTHSIFEAI